MLAGCVKEILSYAVTIRQALTVSLRLDLRLKCTACWPTLDHHQGGKKEESRRRGVQQSFVLAVGGDGPSLGAAIRHWITIRQGQNASTSKWKLSKADVMERRSSREPDETVKNWPLRGSTPCQLSTPLHRRSWETCPRQRPSYRGKQRSRAAPLINLPAPPCHMSSGWQQRQSWPARADMRPLFVPGAYAAAPSLPSLHTIHLFFPAPILTLPHIFSSLLIPDIRLHSSRSAIERANRRAAGHCSLLDTPHCCDSGVCPTIRPARPHLAFGFCPASPDGLAELHLLPFIADHTYIWENRIHHPPFDDHAHHSSPLARRTHPSIHPPDPAVSSNTPPPQRPPPQ